MSDDNNVIEVNAIDFEKKEQAELAENKSSLQEVAYSIAKGSDGIWHLVKIPYNLESKVVGEPVVLKSDGARSIMIENFKIEVARSKLMA